MKVVIGVQGESLELCEVNEENQKLQQENSSYELF